jgi:hypothetical protein
MIKDSLSVRSAAMAFIFPTQPALSREANLKFYDLATQAGLELTEFSQTQTEVTLAQRRHGPPRGQFFVRVDHFGPHLRFLISDEFPTRALSLVQENSDSAWEAFQQVWPLDRIGYPALSEVTIRLTASTEGGNATEYLMKRVMHLPQVALSGLGRQPQGVGVKLMFPIQVGRPERVPLDGADGTLSVETLLEDPSRLYIELLVKWPKIPLPPNAPPGLPAQLNAEVRKPSEYLEDVYGYLSNQVVTFLASSAH